MSYFPFFVKNDNFFWLLLDTGGEDHDREKASVYYAGAYL